MLDIAAIALTPFVLAIAGAAILWARSRLGRPAARRGGPAAVGLATAGWLLLLLGVFGAVAVLTHGFFFMAWVATAVVLAAMVYRNRAAEKRSLLWAMMVAAERGFPLESAARAFAEDRDDHLGSRAEDLADYLESGLPLALALQRSRISVAPSILLAADLGQQTGNLGPALREALRQGDPFDAVLRTASEKLFYLAFLIAFGLGTWIFLLLKIVPAFLKILQDFSFPPPDAMQALIAVSKWTANYWFVLSPLFLALLVFLVSGLLYYVGASPRLLPGLIGLSRRADGAVVMRWLAVAVRGERPIAEMTRLLAGYFPRAGIRRRLERTAKRIDHGMEWPEAFQRAGLIGQAERAVFQSAQRAGNLAWALEEMATSSLRRAAYRLSAAVNVAFPAAILVFGAGVLLAAVGLLSPFMTLLGKLA